MFGLFGGKRRIELKLDKLNYAPGEIIKGIVILDIDKPVKAKKLVVTFYGYRERKTAAYVGFNSSDRRRAEYERQIVYTYELPLDGEKEYCGHAEYAFEIGIPADLKNQLNMQLGNDLFGTMAKAAMFMSGTFYTPIKWFVEAKLDVPFGIDVRKTMQISIVEKPS